MAASAPLAAAIAKAAASPAARIAAAEALAAAARPADVPPVSGSAPTGPAREAEQIARAWLAAEAAAAADPSVLRDFYAEQVAYRGRPAADWDEIAADKARYMRAWPTRQYELLAVHTLRDGSDGHWQAALQVRWRLETQGRWRRGVSITQLTLRRMDGRWRIVAEAGGDSRPMTAAPAAPARAATTASAARAP